MKLIPLSPRRRRLLRNASLAGTLVAAGMLTLSIVATVTDPGSDVVSAAAAGTPPVAESILTPSSGDSSTVFELDPAATAANCEQDSATGGWRWQTFMTSASNDPATFTYDGTIGPVGPSLTQPLWATGGSPVINNNTAPTTGQIVGFQSYSFAVYPAGFVSAGDYLIGYACSDASGVSQQYWATKITVTTDAAGGPGEFTWEQAAVDSSSTTTTTTSSTTTVVGDTTTTTDGSGTTSTSATGTKSATVTPASPAPGGSYQVAFADCTPGETITFSQSASTPATVTGLCEAAATLATGSVQGLRMPAQTTSATASGRFTAAPIAPGSYTVTMTGTTSAQRTVTFVVVAAATPVGGVGSTSGSPSGTNSTGTIPSTGSSTIPVVIWAMLLLVFGRFAVLFGRRPKVCSVDS